MFMFGSPKVAAGWGWGRDRREHKPGVNRLGNAQERKTQRKVNDLRLGPYSGAASQL